MDDFEIPGSRVYQRRLSQLIALLHMLSSLANCPGSLALCFETCWRRQGSGLKGGRAIA